MLGIRLNLFDFIDRPLILLRTPFFVLSYCKNKIIDEFLNQKNK